MLNDLVPSEATLREARPGIWSALPPDAEGARYDARAAAYDRVVGSALYNRLLWGASPERYRAFARRAVASGDGLLLDAGAGSAVFTAGAYADADRPLLLVDRSLGMLEAARDRIADRAGGTLPSSITLLQADANDLPLRARCIDTILSMGMLHLFDDVTGHVAALGQVLAPDGTLFAMCLVDEQWPGRAYLRLLHRAGEVAPPRTYDAMRRAVESGIDATVDGAREGCMAFLTARMGDTM
ncbi:MAG: class I SAM-dependent methyltransferase [Salinibacter sp.]|uniref:class I SAM-dependent methyltransferase n=1 Tax=Salinibacter sp. TaxID=2065818 RepID=UPI0035D48033